MLVLLLSLPLAMLLLLSLPKAEFVFPALNKLFHSYRKIFKEYI